MLIRLSAIITLFFVFFVPFSGKAQILNIEQFRLTKDTANVWLGTGGLGLSVQKQQTSVTELNAKANVVYLSENHSYMSINNIKFINIEESNVISQGYAHLRSNWFRKQFLSYETFAQWQYDLGRGLQWRELYGLSFRFNFISTENIQIAFNSGAMYEHEIWKGNVIRYGREGEDNIAETRFVKSTSNISVNGKLMENINLFLVTYYQARFERFFAPRIISDVSLQFKINKYFSFSSSFQSTYDALPITENNTFVFSFSNSIVLTLN